jgi:hypothetical protein
VEAVVIIRQCEAADKNLILASWLKGQYYSNPYWQHMKPADYYKLYTQKITDILYRPDTRIDIAVMAEDPSIIMGYLVYEGNIVHWAFVKKDFRSTGILKLLVNNKKFDVYTASTKSGTAIAQKYGLSFNPFLGDE